MILTDSTWPDGLLTIFQICRENRELLDTQYYGPYTKLLSYCFGKGFEFFVAPQNPQYDRWKDGIAGPVVLLVVFDAKHRPVLFAEVWDDKWTEYDYGRFEADALMRQRLDEMNSECPVPRLWGMSLFGTSLRVYYCDIATGAVTPTFEEPLIPDTVLNFLEHGWDMDILSQEGFETMKEIVTNIVAGVLAV